MMAWLLSGSRRIEALERALVGLPEAIAALRGQVAGAIHRIDETSAAVRSIGERVDQLAQQAADDEQGGVDLGARMSAVEQAAAAARERLEQLDAASQRDVAALHDVAISLLRLDRQIEAQARDSRTLAEAVMHRIASPPQA